MMDGVGVPGTVGNTSYLDNTWDTQQAGRAEAWQQAVTEAHAHPQTQSPGVLEQAWDWTKHVAGGVAHAAGTFDADNGRVLTRTLGAVQAVAGTAEAAAGAALVAGGTVADGTGVGAVIGVPAQLLGGAMVLNGADNAQAGVRTTVSGHITNTVIAEGTGAAAHALGVSQATADRISTGVGTAQGIGAGGIAAAPKTVATVARSLGRATGVMSDAATAVRTGEATAPPLTRAADAIGEAAGPAHIAGVAETSAHTGSTAIQVTHPIMPNAGNAEIPSQKITSYALNPDHPIGGNKARVFKSALGFDQSNAGDLTCQIKDGIARYPAQPGRADQFGRRYTVDIPVTGPAGSGTVRTGWIIKPGSDAPSLTTLFVK